MGRVFEYRIEREGGIPGESVHGNRCKRHLVKTAQMERALGKVAIIWRREVVGLYERGQWEVHNEA